jgi:hypothetical protein
MAMDRTEALAEALSMATERTTEGAHSRMDLHEAVCGERYRNINQALNEVKAMLLAQGSDMHERLNTISNRMWAVVLGTLGGSVVGLGVLAFFLITKGK